MNIFTKIAEKKIDEAIKKGELDGLSCSGKALASLIDDDAHIGDDQRMAFKVLKNSGLLPPELELRGEITTLKELSYTSDDEGERLKILREIEYKLLKLNMQRKALAPLSLDDFPCFGESLVEKALIRARDKNKT